MMNISKAEKEFGFRSKRKRIIQGGFQLLSDHDLYAKMPQTKNPYGDGKAAFKIREALSNCV